MGNFRDVDRQTAFLLPPSVDESLPERHLARFIVEVIEGLDLGGMIGAYRGSGSAAHHPRMLLGVLIYGYATGVFSSRKLERATYAAVDLLLSILPSQGQSVPRSGDRSRASSHTRRAATLED